MVQGLLQIQHQLHLSLIIHNPTRGSYTAQAAQREIGRRPRPRSYWKFGYSGQLLVWQPQSCLHFSIGSCVCNQLPLIPTARCHLSRWRCDKATCKKYEPTNWIQFCHCDGEDIVYGRRRSGTIRWLLAIQSMSGPLDRVVVAGSAH